MKKLSIVLILSGIILAIGYFLYELLLVEYNIPLVISIAILALVSGIVIMIIDLVVERIKDRKDENKDDLSKY